MIIKSLKKQIDYRVDGSIAQKARNKRMNMFNEYFEKTFSWEIENKQIIRILDVGGVPSFWEYLNFKYINYVSITSLNLEMMTVPKKFVEIIKSVKGTATNMIEFEDLSFDLVFSNSVIEHVGEFEEQKKAAVEMRRVGRHGFIQTPNKYFFMEPHFLFPYFQLLPHKCREDMCMMFNMGYFQRATTREEAKHIVDDVHLLSRKQFVELFPKKEIVREKWFGLTKSYIAKW